MPTISFSIGGEKHDISGKSGKEVVGLVVKEIKKKKLIVRKKKEDRPIEETNDNCSKCDIILTDDDMDSETGKCELCNEEDEDEEDMNMDTPNYKQKIEEACPVGHITVWGDHGFIYEVELKEYNGVMLPKYINGREVLCYPNAGRFVEEKIEKCEKCDIRLGIYDGNYEMKVEWFGKTMCGKCAYVKAERKEIK